MEPVPSMQNIPAPIPPIGKAILLRCSFLYGELYGLLIFGGENVDSFSSSGVSAAFTIPAGTIDATGEKAAPTLLIPMAFMNDRRPGFFFIITQCENCSM